MWEMIKLFFLYLKKYWSMLLLGAGVVVGYLAFIKKQKPEDLKERPEKLEVDIPERPKETDFVAKQREKIEKIEADRKKIKDRHEYLKMMNENNKKGKYDG